MEFTNFGKYRYLTELILEHFCPSKIRVNVVIEQFSLSRGWKSYGIIDERKCKNPEFT